jgi:hypothetical protein
MHHPPQEERAVSPARGSQELALIWAQTMQDSVELANTSGGLSGDQLYRFIAYVLYVTLAQGQAAPVTAIDGNVGRQVPTSTNKTGLQQREGRFSKEKNPCKRGF